MNVIASVIGRAAPLTTQSPHVCENPQPISAATREVQALPTIDRWGVLAPQSLSTRPHPRSQLTRWAGPVAVHRSAASPAPAAEDGGADVGVGGGSRRVDHASGARRRDAGTGTREMTPDIDVAGPRAGELEKRSRHILDRANLDN